MVYGQTHSLLICKYTIYWNSFHNNLFQHLQELQKYELLKEQTCLELEGLSLDYKSDEDAFVTAPPSPIITHWSVKIQTNLSLTTTNIEINLDFLPTQIYLELNPQIRRMDTATNAPTTQGPVNVLSLHILEFTRMREEFAVFLQCLEMEFAVNCYTFTATTPITWLLVITTFLSFLSCLSFLSITCLHYIASSCLASCIPALLMPPCLHMYLAWQPLNW